MKKVVVAGLGFIGRVHVKNILKNPGLELVAVVDKDINRIMSELNSKTGNFSTENIDPQSLAEISIYSDLDQCLKKEQPDAVHICVHTDMHYELTKKALENGLNVLVEKPFTLNPEQGEELIMLAKKKGLLLMVAHVVRFMPPYEKLKEWIDNSRFGKLEFLSLIRFSGVPSWGQWKDKQKKFGSSGGALFDLLIHDIDMAYFIMGACPDKVNSFFLPGMLSDHDYMDSKWEYTDKGLTVKIEGGNIFHSGFPFSSGFTARFEKASVSYSTTKPDVIIVSDNEKTIEVETEDFGGGYYNEIDYFYNCLSSGSEPLKCRPGDSLEAVRLCYELI